MNHIILHLIKWSKGTTPTLTIKKEPVDDSQIDIGEFLESIGDTISPLGKHVQNDSSVMTNSYESWIYYDLLKSAT